MNGYKRELMPLYSYYDRSGIARHLEQMAAKGWMLTGSAAGAGATAAQSHSACAFPSPISPLPLSTIPAPARGWRLCGTTAPRRAGP